MQGVVFTWTLALAKRGAGHRVAFRQKIEVDRAAVEKLCAAGDYTFDQIADIFGIAHHGNLQASVRQMTGNGCATETHKRGRNAQSERRSILLGQIRGIPEICEPTFLWRGNGYLALKNVTNMDSPRLAA